MQGRQQGLGGAQVPQRVKGPRGGVPEGGVGRLELLDEPVELLAAAVAASEQRILLFVRQAKRDERGLTMPYLFLGPARCVSASGERPIQIVWELEHEMPAGWFSGVKIAAA